MRDKILAALGFSNTLRYRIKNEMDLELLIRQGLPWSTSKFLKSSLDLTNEELARIFGVSEQSMTRLSKNCKRIPSSASDRLYRLAKIFALAIDVFEDKVRAKCLFRPN